jgi:hypothetical protein
LSKASHPSGSALPPAPINFVDRGQIMKDVRRALTA